VINIKSKITHVTLSEFLSNARKAKVVIWRNTKSIIRPLQTYKGVTPVFREMDGISFDWDGATHPPTFSVLGYVPDDIHPDNYVMRLWSNEGEFVIKYSDTVGLYYNHAEEAYVTKTLMIKLLTLKNIKPSISL